MVNLVLVAIIPTQLTSVQANSVVDSTLKRNSYSAMGQIQPTFILPRRLFTGCVPVAAGLGARRIFEPPGLCIYC